MGAHDGAESEPGPWTPACRTSPPVKWQEVTIKGLGLLRGGRRGPTCPRRLAEPRKAPGAALMRPGPRGAGGVGAETHWMSASLAKQGPCSRRLSRAASAPAL